MPECTQADVLIIGAGPAGSVLSIYLRDRGFDVVVVEQARFPRFVIGESLLPRCMDLLDAAGLIDVCAARGYTLKDGAFFVDGPRRTAIDFADQHTDGWTYTWQVPRDDFDQTLADAAAARGVRFFFEATLTALDLALDDDVPPRACIDTPDGPREITCRFVVDASGFGRLLARRFGLDEPSSQPPRTAVFTHVTADRRPGGASGARTGIGVHPCGAWSWLIPFSDGRTSIGLVGDAPALDALGDDPSAILREAINTDPAWAVRLSDAIELFPARRVEAFAHQPRRTWGPRWCMVGHSSGFVDPVFSSGVTLALESAWRAAPLIEAAVNGAPADWDADYVAPIAAGSEVFRTYVNAWYDGRLRTILFAENQNPLIRRQICSVLAGYVWDHSNPFVAEHSRRVAGLSRYLAR